MTRNNPLSIACTWTPFLPVSCFSSSTMKISSGSLGGKEAFSKMSLKKKHLGSLTGERSGKYKERKSGYIQSYLSGNPCLFYSYFSKLLLPTFCKIFHFILRRIFLFSQRITLIYSVTKPYIVIKLYFRDKPNHFSLLKMYVRRFSKQIIVIL